MKLALVSMEQNAADPPLGLAYLSSYIKKHSDIRDIKIIDKEDILETIKNNKFDMIGISAMTTDFKKANQYAKSINKITNVPLIIGGVHITIMPHHLKNSAFSIAVIGEGEQTLLELCKLFKEKGSLPLEDLKNINGIIIKGENGDLIYTPKRDFITDLDEIPYPDRDSLKMKEIYTVPQIKAGVDNIGIFTTMFTSRGCPYNCKFCSSSSFWERKIRFNSPEYVVNEIELLSKKYGIEGIHILDDLFVVDKKRVKRIVEMLEERGLNKKIRFSLLLRSNLVNEDLMQDLKKMNVTHIGFGFESGSPKMLSYLKGEAITIDHHKNAIKLCKKYGLQVSGSFLFGNPHETKEDMQMTIEFIKNNPFDQMNVNQLIPMPRTAVWDYAKEAGFVNDSFDFTVNKLSNLFVHKYNPMILTQEVSEEEFRKLFGIAQDLVKSSKVNNFKFKFSYFKYLKNPRFMLKIFKRWKRVLFMLGLRKQDIA